MFVSNQGAVKNPSEKPGPERSNWIHKCLNMAHGGEHESPTPHLPNKLSKRFLLEENDLLGGAPFRFHVCFWEGYFGRFFDLDIDYGSMFCFVGRANQMDLPPAPPSPFQVRAFQHTSLSAHSDILGGTTCFRWFCACIFPVGNTAMCPLSGPPQKKETQRILFNNRLINHA